MADFLPQEEGAGVGSGYINVSNVLTKADAGCRTYVIDFVLHFLH